LPLPILEALALVVFGTEKFKSFVSFTDPLNLCFIMDLINRASKRVIKPVYCANIPTYQLSFCLLHISLTFDDLIFVLLLNGIIAVAVLFFINIKNEAYWI
jgi:hypothetical protein